MVWGAGLSSSYSPLSNSVLRTPKDVQDNDLKWCVTLLYSELLAAALRYRYAINKFSTTDALLVANTPYYLAATCPLFPVPYSLSPIHLIS